MFLCEVKAGALSVQVQKYNHKEERPMCCFSRNTSWFSTCGNAAVRPSAYKS
jgi:hypothetical protein